LVTPCWKGVALCKAPTFFFLVFIFFYDIRQVSLGYHGKKKKDMHSKSGMFVTTNISFFEMPHHM
jgi:hypothetical protein